MMNPTSDIPASSDASTHPLLPFLRRVARAASVGVSVSESFGVEDVQRGTSAADRCRERYAPREAFDRRQSDRCVLEDRPPV